MSAKKAPVTKAIRALRDAGATYTEYLYDYRRYPGALGAADYIGINPHLTAKTIVLATNEGNGVIVLMNGDREVSTKTLARLLGVKETRPANQKEALAWTGYQFGGTSPLGLRTKLPVFAQSDIARLDTTYVNAGSRGFVIGIDPEVLLSLSNARIVEVAS
ncbi:MAG: YbaK/EbsC family protein [Acidimicrobiia bacterium]